MDVSVSPVSTRWRRQLTHLSGGMSAISAENFSAVPCGRGSLKEGSSGVARRSSEGFSERSVSTSADRKSTRLNSTPTLNSYSVFFFKKKKKIQLETAETYD